MQQRVAVETDKTALSLNSSFIEKMVEHVFVSEILQEAWFRHGKIVEVLRSEIDAAGHDIVLECDGVLRHVQLKTSREGGKTSRQNVNVALAEKTSGCVVWMVRNEDQGRVRLKYLFFGNAPGTKISLDGLATGKHAKGNAEGVKLERPAIRVVPKNRFCELENIGQLLEALFDGSWWTSNTAGRAS